ncbi:MAG: response regulator [Gammaproteobacteria bacterium]|nr:response regulator [Gammaproteobacteria bacterium]
MGDSDPSGDRASRLSAAILRVNASLDLATVLQEVLESARALTGARVGVITTIDGRGRLEDFVTSGLVPEERRRMVAWPDGQRLFAHLRDLPSPLRVADTQDYLRSLGMSPQPWASSTLQGTPMHRDGEHLGNFFLGDKEDGEAFTSADEEILVLFASQAALAIANARTHRDVERARADLAALVETSPVGVAVFDAATGHPVSFNREARRIVEHLLTPGRPKEELLEVATCRYASGREVSLAELPLSRLLGHAEPVRAEEVELSVPDGRSVRALLNLTPIRSEAGDIVSVVVTMQDLAPLEELERMRAEFLGMVSHELRAPLTSIKGSASTVLDAEPLPSQAEMVQFFRIIGGQADHMRGLISNLLDAGSIEAGTLTVQPESSELAVLVERARNTFVSGGGRQAVLIDLPPDLPRVMADRERIVQVLNNLLSNAGRQSPPSSAIRVEAAPEGAYVAVSVSDEGRGIPPERLGQLFRKRVRPGEGTGLGLAISKGLAEAHGGRIRAESAGTGQGARFTFTIPAAGEAEPEAAATPSGGPGPRAGRRDRGRILVVDDDPHTLRYVRDILSDAGYAPIATGSPDEIPTLIRAERPRLVLLDLVLPGADGIELMEQLPELADLPVIFISVYGRDETIARALAGGAADYVVKPFSPTELVARVQAALRVRARPETFVHGELAVDFGQRRVTVAGREIRLTAIELELLRVLSAAGGRVVTTEALLRKVWGRRDSGDTDRMRTALKKLRAKLGDDAADPTYIFNEYGIGYRFARPGGA